MLVAPPIGTTKTPSPGRSRPGRAARVCTAAWSLMPSTSTTVQEPGALRARAAASVTAASHSTSTSSSLAAGICSEAPIASVHTHVGSLARPAALLDLMKAAATGNPPDPAERAEQEQQAVAEVVAWQRAAGLDVISDGEQSKPGFFAYIGERLSGFEPRPERDPLAGFRAEIEGFPEYYEQYLEGAMTGGMAAPAVPLGCTGPVSYTGHQRLRRDLEQLRQGGRRRRAGRGVRLRGGAERGRRQRVLPDRSRLPGRRGRRPARGVRGDRGGGLHPAGRRPVPHRRVQLRPRVRRDKLDKARLYVSAINRSLRGLPPERVRLHTCYGINEGPRVHDAPLADLADTLFTIEAGAFSFEAANPRHEHVYHVFESVKPPPDAVLLPGVISHATNIVEHPDTIADRIVRFAELVGRENVVASADCGFSSQATYRPEIHPQIVRAKFGALAEGARRATARLWR